MVHTTHCGRVYHSDETHIGKSFRCAVCGGLVPILGPTRGIVGAPGSRPLYTQSNRPQAVAPARRRFRTFYVIAAALGAIVIMAGGGLFVHFGCPAGVDSSTALRQQTAESQQADSRGVQILSEEPVPKENPGRFFSGGLQVLGEYDPESERKKRPSQPSDPRPTHYNSPLTGTHCAQHEDIDDDGHGELTVENGTGEDAQVRLFPESGIDLNGDSIYGHPLRCFFVQSHASGQVGKIPGGTYVLTFTTGLNWVESEEQFRWHPSYSEFEHTFEFREQHDSEGLQYHSITVTLHPVPSGNVRTKLITREEFLKGHRPVAP
jgi:hypothetical protein